MEQSINKDNMKMEQRQANGYFSPKKELKQKETTKMEFKQVHKQSKMSLVDLYFKMEERTGSYKRDFKTEFNLEL